MYVEGSLYRSLLFLCFSEDLSRLMTEFWVDGELFVLLSNAYFVASIRTSCLCVS